MDQLVTQNKKVKVEQPNMFKQMAKDRLEARNNFVNRRHGDLEIRNRDQTQNFYFTERE